MCQRDGENESWITEVDFGRKWCAVEDKAKNKRKREGNSLLQVRFVAGAVLSAAPQGRGYSWDIWL